LDVVATPQHRSVSASLQIGAFVGTESWSTGNVFIPNVGLTGLFELVRAQQRFGLVLDGELRATAAASTFYGNVDLTGVGAHALLSYGRPLGRGLGRVGLGPGLAVSDVRVTPQTGVLTPAATVQPRTDVDATVALQLRWDLPLSTFMQAFVVAGADVAIVSGRYTAVVDGTTTTLLAPWRVRPTLRLGFAFGR
jgi:hypothetical protein